MIHEKLLIQNKLGIHTRAAAKLVDLAKRFQSKIEIVFRERKVDCKSIMNVLTLGAQKDHTVEFYINGEDEHEAAHKIKELLDNKFDEKE